MQYRRLGNSGLKLSELSFGSWVTYGNQLAEDTARECMAAAHDAGVNFFDNAEVYARSDEAAERRTPDASAAAPIDSGSGLARRSARAPAVSV